MTQTTLSSPSTAPLLNTTTTFPSTVFDPSHVNLQTVNPKDVICFLTAASNDDYGEDHRSARLSSMFVIFVVSTVATMFPVLASRVKWLRIPLYVYLMVRYLGAGVIIATAFIHLLDPAYSEIGPQTCVGLTGAWASYSWPPALAMTSAMFMFLIDFMIECHVQAKLGVKNVHGDVEGTITISPERQQQQQQQQQQHSHNNSQHNSQQQHELHPSTAQITTPSIESRLRNQTTVLYHDNDDEKTEEVPPNSVVMDPVAVYEDGAVLSYSPRNQTSIHVHTTTRPSTDAAVSSRSRTSTDTSATSSSHTATAHNHNPTACPTNARSFQEQIAAFLVLECGVIFHSIIIGLNLGVSGTEFRTLYPVLVFHQCFEGMGIGARLSIIPFPARYGCVPWLLCLAFGMTTPIAVAIGLSLRTSYRPDSFTADVVSGVFDSISAGILLYTGFVELLARDFLFHPERSLDKYRVSFMVCCLYLGMAIMGLLGKWA